MFSQHLNRVVSTQPHCVQDFLGSRQQPVPSLQVSCVSSGQYLSSAFFSPFWQHLMKVESMHPQVVQSKPGRIQQPLPFSHEFDSRHLHFVQVKPVLQQPLPFSQAFLVPSQQGSSTSQQSPSLIQIAGPPQDTKPSSLPFRQCTAWCNHKTSRHHSTGH